MTIISVGRLRSIIDRGDPLDPREQEALQRARILWDKIVPEAMEYYKKTKEVANDLMFRDDEASARIASSGRLRLHKAMSAVADILWPGCFLAPLA